ncbi:hypothetical protein G9A89_000271, partial [Geosiphon pyriformis]
MIIMQQVIYKAQKVKRIRAVFVKPNLIVSSHSTEKGQATSGFTLVRALRLISACFPIGILAFASASDSADILLAYWPFAPASDGWKQNLDPFWCVRACPKADFGMFSSWYGWKQSAESPLVHVCPKADSLYQVGLVYYYTHSNLMNDLFLFRMYDSIIEEYLNATKYNGWSILSILQCIEFKNGLSINNIYARQRHHQQRPNVQQRAIDKLRTLLKDQHQWFNTIEVESFMDELQKKEEKESDDENASDIASESDIFHSDVEEKMHEL